MDVNSILIWQRFNCYRFVEKSHTYYYNNSKVKYSVTQYIDRFFEPFDSQGISKKYSEKHGKCQQEVLDEWERKGKVSALAGTAIHSYMENLKRGKDFDIDYNPAKEAGLFEDVKEIVDKLLPQARAFHEDTLGKLFPVQLEYTVGIEDIIAGNIDMLCWNSWANEFQIWDYKNLKEMSEKNYYGKRCLRSFSKYDDCSLVHYSIQLGIYKAIVERQLGVKIGNCYLVHFDYQSKNPEFRVHRCIDLQQECRYELELLIKEQSYDN